MEILKKKKHRIWLYTAGMILIPYPLLLLSGMISERFPQMYAHAEIILLLFAALIAVFAVLIGRAVSDYQKAKKQSLNNE